jgi:hypothetical protein
LSDLNVMSVINVMHTCMYESTVLAPQAERDPHVSPHSAVTKVTLTNSAHEVRSILDRKMAKGCKTCRARRVKCDRQDSGVCRNCLRIGEECVRDDNWKRTSKGDGENPDGKEYTQAGLKRRRNASSCLRCRRMKRKCSGGLPCTRCMSSKSQETCTYSEERVQLRESVTNINCPLAAEEICTDFPDSALQYSLVKRFFAGISRIKLMGFLHEPSFMRRLNEGHKFESLDDRLLLLSLCAVSTKEDYSLNPELWERGIKWAQHALCLLMTSLDKVTVERLMAIVLLYEHELRVGNYGACFLLSSLSTRYTQALQLNFEQNIESDQAFTAVDKESRRRLMWCCYSNESIMASGVGQIQMINFRNIQIQLPMSDEWFMFKKDCVTEKLLSGGGSGSISQVNGGKETMDHRALLVKIVYLREKVLSYVKRFDKDVEIWNTSSEFNVILQELDDWEKVLPESLILDDTVIYIQRERGLLHSLLHIHLFYHLCYCDLYRIILPGLSYAMKRQIDSIQLLAPTEFLEYCQDSCFAHASELSSILRLAVQHEQYGTMSDPGDMIAAHEATRVEILYMYVAGDRIPENVYQSIPNMLENNVQYLKELARKFPCTDRCLRRTRTLINNFAQENNSADPESIESTLHPLANFRIIREQVRSQSGYNVYGDAALKNKQDSNTVFTEFASLFEAFSPYNIETWLNGE